MPTIKGVNFLRLLLENGVYLRFTYRLRENQVTHGIPDAIKKKIISKFFV